jgi:hypothetical protein
LETKGGSASPEDDAKYSPKALDNNAQLLQRRKFAAQRRIFSQRLEDNAFHRELRLD